VTAAVLDVHGMIGNGGIQIGDGERAAVIRLGVVVFETKDPFADGSFSGPLAKRCLNGGNGTEVTIHHAKVREAGFGGVGVSINEARKDRFTAEIEFAGSRAGKIQNVRIASDREKSAAGNGHSLSAGFSAVHGENIGVVQDEIRLLLFERKKGKGSEGAKKFAARRFV
jgi:hypothetical protein